MKPLHILLLSQIIAGAVSAVDVIKTWTGAASNSLNAVDNWNNNQRPTFGATANTDALIFDGAGSGVVNVNVDATAKSITISGPQKLTILAQPTSYDFRGTLPLRLGDTTTGTVQPNTGTITNNSEATVTFTTSGGLFFNFGTLNAAVSPFYVGAASFVNIGGSSAAVGRNLTVTGPANTTFVGLIEGLGTQASAGGHLFKSGSGVLALAGNSELWNGRIFVQEGMVSVTRANSLGSVAGDTSLSGGAAGGRVEFSGNITVAEPFRLAGRDTAGLPGLVNASGNNVLTGPIQLDAGGSEYAVASQGGLLEINGPLSYGTNDQPAVLRLKGTAAGAVNGALGVTGNPLSVVKEDSGVWSLRGPSVFTGSIAVAAGELEISTAHSGGGAISQAAGSTLAVRVAAPGGSLQTSALNVTGGAGTRLVFDFGTHGLPTVPVLSAAALAFDSEVAVSLRAAALGTGQYPLISYQGSIGGAGFGALSLTGLPPRLSAQLVHDEPNRLVRLDINGFDQPKWTGATGADWDANDGTGTGSFNWREVISGLPTRYLQGEGGTDSVLFDDSATGPTAINLTGEISPIGITVNNSTLSYEFTGPGFLSGSGGLSKQGTGTLRIANEAANTFSGLTSIGAGTLEIGDGVTNGRGSLGSGPIQNEGVLLLNRPDTFTVSGSISGTGSVVKRTAGIGVLAGNSDFTGPVLIEQGTLRLGTGGALGAPSGLVTVSPGATLDFRGQLLPVGKVVSVSGNGVGGAGAVINSSAGGSAVGLRSLVFTGPATIGGSQRWDIRDAPGGVQVNGHDLIKAGSNSVFWANLGETGISNLRITGTGSRLAFEGDTTLGASPGSIVVEGGAALGFNASTVLHTKPIRVEGGTINFSDGIANQVSSTITIVSDATINTAAGVEAVVSGKLTGNGSLTKTTGGILKLTHDQNDYSGNTSINAGQLWIGNDGPSGSLPPGDVFLNGGTLIVRRWGELVLSQNISGTSAFQIPNVTYPIPQAVTLSGNNSFTGAVTLARGTLRITNSSALGQGEKLVNIQGGRPTLILDGGEAGLTLSPELTFRISSDGPQGGLQNISGATVVGGLINLFNQGGGHARIRGDGGSLTLNGDIRIVPLADHAATTGNRNLLLDGVLGGVLNGSIRGPELPEDTRLLSLIKEGPGTWLLNGLNTYRGSTTISEGTLKLGPGASITATPNITLSGAAVLDISEQPGFSLATGQTLTGQGGIVGSLTVGTGSAIVPGAALTAGTLAISGNLALAGGRANVSFTSSTVAGQGINDLITVAGDLSITSATTIELLTNGQPLSGSYPMIEYGGEFTGDTTLLTLINPTRYSAAFDATSQPGKLLLVIEGVLTPLVWNGAADGNWNFNSAANWSGAGSTFLTADQVVFDDTAPADRRSIAVVGALRPSSITVDTETGYTFNFTGNANTNSITGVTGLTKLGTGALTLIGTGAFNGSGKTSIQGGSIILSSNVNGFTQSRWIELQAGTVLNTSALIAGFNLGNTPDQRVLSGVGTVVGSLVVGGVSVIKPGLSSNPLDQATAGDQIGVLTINGSLGLLGGAPTGNPRAVFRIGGFTGQVADQFDAPAIAAFGTISASQHDQLIVTGTLALDEGSTIRLELVNGYVPAFGDVFNIADWGSLVLDADGVGGQFDPLAANAFDLPALPEGLYWNRSQFIENGLLYISQTPPTVGQIEFTPGATVNPGTVVTLSAAVSGPAPYTYQWFFNGTKIELSSNATAESAALVLTAAEALQGEYVLVVTNAIGPTASAPASLSVNDPIVITQDPQSLVLNPGQTAVFVVAGTGTGPFTFQWRKNGEPIPEQEADALEIPSVTEAAEGVYDVVIANVVGTAISSPATLSVNDPVAILVPPQNIGANVGQNVLFTAQVSGTGPLTYRWLKNNVEIPGSAGAQATLSLTNVTVADEGNYTVRISNSVNSVTSSAGALLVATSTPKVITQSTHQLLRLGSPLSLQVNAIGLPPLRYQWFLNGRRIAGATSPSLLLPSAQLKDAGTYRLDIIGGLTVSSTDIQVGVVETTARDVPLVLGSAAQLRVRTAGAGLTFAWQKDGNGLDDSTRIKGSDKNTLSLGKPLTDNDTGLYTLIVNGPGGSLATDGHTLKVFSEAPEITENPPVFAPAIVSGTFSYQIKVDADPKKAPTTYTAKGLPPGLKIDRLTGVITGKPTAVSRDPLGYLVTLTASNSRGKSEAQGRLVVQNINPLLIGAYNGSLGRDAALNEGLGGSIDLNVTAKGPFTGRLALGPTTLSFRGVLDAIPGSLAATGIVTLPRRGSTALTLSFTLDGANRISTATLSDGTATLAFNGWRNVWNARTNPALNAFAAYHTLGLDLTTQAGVEGVPQGNGYASITLAAAGTVRVVGKLADGETLTGSTFTGPIGQVSVFQLLYKSRPRGSVQGSLDLNPTDLTGALTWWRPADAKAKLYSTGFPGVVGLTAVGGPYAAPAAGKVFLNLDPGLSNALLSLNGGGIEASVANPADLDLLTSIIIRSVATVTTDPSKNPRKVSLKLVEKTGLLSGIVELEDSVSGRPLKRRVPVQAIAVPQTGGLKANGYFILNGLTANDPGLSGQVILQAAF